LTLYPLIFLNNESLRGNSVVVNHERIHLRQQLELLIVPFYIIYGLEFVFRLIAYKNWKEAYHNISFEREAYKNEKDLDYLKRRQMWTFLKYLCLGLKL